MQKSLSRLLLLILTVCLLGVSSLQAQKYTPDTYIEKYGPIAQELMKESGVPASVILAVAMHESAHGNSRIANHLNNHFGIKGKNSSKKIRSAYKGYSSAMSSYEDFINLLKKRKHTTSLFDDQNKNYTSWVKAIARSGYSATKSWSSLILRTISRYNLDKYDSVN